MTQRDAPRHIHLLARLRRDRDGRRGALRLEALLRRLSLARPEVVDNDLALAPGGRARDSDSERGSAGPSGAREETELEREEMTRGEEEEVMGHYIIKRGAA